MNSSITITAVIELDRGGWVICWREKIGGAGHNTFTRDPQRWIDGYNRGESLESLQSPPDLKGPKP